MHFEASRVSPRSRFCWADWRAAVPSQRHDIARLGLRVVIDGTLVTLMNAALAGLFFSLQSIGILA